MLRTLNSVDSTGKVNPVLVTTINGYAWVMIQVKGAVSIAISNSRQELIDSFENALVFGGIEITPAMMLGLGAFGFWWSGPLYAVSTVLPPGGNATFSLQVLQC